MHSMCAHVQEVPRIHGLVKGDREKQKQIYTFLSSSLSTIHCLFCLNIIPSEWVSNGIMLVLLELLSITNLV